MKVLYNLFLCFMAFFKPSVSHVDLFLLRFFTLTTGKASWNKFLLFRWLILTELIISFWVYFDKEWYEILGNPW